MRGRGGGAAAAVYEGTSRRPPELVPLDQVDRGMCCPAIFVSIAKVWVRLGTRSVTTPPTWGGLLVVG